MKLWMKLQVMILDDVPDSQGDVFDPDGVSMTEYCHVTYEFSDELRNRLGRATLSKSNGNIYANIKLNSDWAQDMPAIKLLTPVVGGMIAERGSDGKILKCLINQISLTAHPADKRIKTVGDQLWEIARRETLP